MSLISGMETMMDFQDASKEMANKNIIFQEEIAMEASELIDAMVDGYPRDYSMVEDEFEENEDEAMEAAALTGSAFLNSLMIDTDDPIVTKPGSLGPEDSAANFSTNFHDDFPGKPDGIDRTYGSVGPDGSEANFEGNFHDEFIDDNDPLEAIPGSLGPETSTAKDPAMESAYILGSLMGEYEIVEEGFLSRRQEKRKKKQDLDFSMLGIQKPNHEKIDQMMNAGNYRGAQNEVKRTLSQIQRAKDMIPAGDVDAKQKAKAARRLGSAYSSLMIGINIEKDIADLEKKGYDKKTARKAAVKKAKQYEKSMKDAARLDKVTEAAIDTAVQYYEIVCEDYEDAGSKGQQDSAADFKGNYSDGIKDNDPREWTRDGSEGQQDSAASFDGNYGGGHLDTDDPIITGDSSVGPTDSTAKDPASEAYTDIFDELDKLNDIMENSVF